MFRNEIAAVPRFQSGCGQSRGHSPTILCRNCVGSGEVEKLDTLFCPLLQPCLTAPPPPPRHRYEAFLIITFPNACKYSYFQLL